MQAYGNITRALNKIREASTPERFTQDFLSTKLGLSGGGARPVIPFLKRTGFLGSDGAPTELYKRFRNPSHGGAAAAEALRIGYAPLYEVNESIHDASEPTIKGIIVQITGAEPDSSTVSATVKSFKALRAFADFAAATDEEDEGVTGDGVEGGTVATTNGSGVRAAIKLGYTINLNLPATSDIAVFNAIFKSLREHLLP
jgi:hypothetical protein